MHACIYTLYVYLYVYMHVCVYMDVYIYICIYVCMHACTMYVSHACTTARMTTRTLKNVRNNTIRFFLKFWPFLLLCPSLFYVAVGQQIFLHDWSVDGSNDFKLHSYFLYLNIKIHNYKIYLNLLWQNPRY